MSTQVKKTEASEIVCHRCGQKYSTEKAKQIKFCQRCDALLVLKWMQQKQ